jgi:hypothetical protein
VAASGELVALLSAESASAEAGFAAAGLDSLAVAFAGAFSAGLGKADLSFAATGGAIVDDPPLTYSPSSSSFAKATLVSIPSSFAMSYTRGSATFSPVQGQTRTGQAAMAEGNSFRVTHFFDCMLSAFDSE